MQAVTDLCAVVGIVAACDALGIACAAFYRRHALGQAPITDDR